MAPPPPSSTSTGDATMAHRQRRLTQMQCGRAIHCMAHGLARLSDYMLDLHAEFHDDGVDFRNYKGVVKHIGRDVAQLNAEFSMIRRSVTRKLQRQMAREERRPTTQTAAGTSRARSTVAVTHKATTKHPSVYVQAANEQQAITIASTYDGDEYEETDHFPSTSLMGGHYGLDDDSDVELGDGWHALYFDPHDSNGGARRGAKRKMQLAAAKKKAKVRRKRTSEMRLPSISTNQNLFESDGMMDTSPFV